MEIGVLYKKTGERFYMVYFCKADKRMGHLTKEEKDKKVISFLVDNKYRFKRHIILTVGLLILLYNSGFTNELQGIEKYYRLLTVYSVFIFMFYVNIYILVPYYFFKARYILYLFLLILLVLTGLNIISFVMNNLLSNYRVNRFFIKGVYEGSVISVSVIMVTTTIKLLQRWVKDNESISELKNLTLNMELNELKNQINPHFLFNMLNNVKALIRTNPEKATMVIIKLSEFLRYQLYENNEQKTPLNSEINFISNFLNLEKIRRDNFRFDIEFESDEKKLANVFIPPNLFTTFIENAVKHSFNLSEKEAFIKVKIKKEDNKLHFVCINSKGFQRNEDEKYSGLGLANIKRRLELLFENEYNLDIESTEEEYKIKLSIPI